MFSKKTRVLIATAVLTALGVAVTGVASARFNGASTGTSVAAVSYTHLTLPTILLV